MKIITAVLVSFIIVGCASTLRIPITSFVRSENVGQAGASLETFVTQAVRLQAVQDFRATPIDGTPRIDNTVATGFHGTLGFFNAVEFYWGWVPGGPNTAGLKFQLWGESFRTSKKGNFSLSLALGSGLYVASAGVPADQVQGTPPTARRGYIIEYASPHAELSFGFRPFDILLLNLGYYRSKMSYAVSFDEGLRDVYDRAGALTIIHLGANVKYSILLLGLDIAKSQLTFGTLGQSNLSFGFNGGLVW